MIKSTDLTPELIFDKRVPKPLSIDKFAKVSSVALHDKSLTSRDKIVYVALCEFANRNGLCFPSVAKVAEIAGVGKTSVHLALTVLESRGYIERQSRIRSSNIYRISPIPINDLWRGAGESIAGETVDNSENVEKSPAHQVGQIVDKSTSLSEVPSSPGEARNIADKCSFSEQPRTRGEYFIDSDGEELIFDERTGRLQYANSNSSAGEDRTRDLKESLTKEWKDNCPHHKTGFEKPKDEKVFDSYLRANPCSLQFFKKMIEMIKKSPFLAGENPSGWRCSLFWALKKRKEIVSGKYLPITQMSEEQKIKFKII